MKGLAALGIWNDAAIHDALSWYLAVAENRRPAKFRIAATVPAELDLSTSSEEALWAELEQARRHDPHHHRRTRRQDHPVPSPGKNPA